FYSARRIFSKNDHQPVQLTVAVHQVDALPRHAQPAVLPDDAVPAGARVQPLNVAPELYELKLGAHGPVRFKGKVGHDPAGARARLLGMQVRIVEAAHPRLE